MNRWTRNLMIGIALLLVLPFTIALAQEAPPPEATEVPEAIAAEVHPAEGPSLHLETTQELLINARLDLELLANALNVQRPEGWSGSLDIADPQLALLIRLDLELLAGMLLGADTRPPGWFGVVPSSPYYVARDIRHDLELLADTVLPPDQSRPADWLGSADPLLVCDRSTQALVAFLVLNGVFTLDVDPAAPDFCAKAINAATTFVELNYLENLAQVTMTETGFVGTATVNSNFAVGFYDRHAARRAGVIPEGTPLQPIARSYAQYSNMILAQGEDFEVFVDYQFTTLTQEEFRALPNVDDVTYETTCAAEWCEYRG